jgi:hypothetical protein
MSSSEDTCRKELVTKDPKVKFYLQLTSTQLDIIQDNDITSILHFHVVEGEYKVFSDPKTKEKKYLLRIEANINCNEKGLTVPEPNKPNLPKKFNFENNEDAEVVRKSYENVKMSSFDKDDQFTGLICYNQRQAVKFKYSLLINFHEWIFYPVNSNDTTFLTPLKIEPNALESVDFTDLKECTIKYKFKKTRIFEFINEADFLEFKNKHLDLLEKERSKRISPKEPLDLDKFKLYLLENNPGLKKLHKELVRSNLMAEEEFWSTRNEVKEYEKMALEDRQKLGKSSSLLLVTRQIGNEKILPKICDEEINRILQQYPRVKEFYLREIKENDKKAAIEFWDEFMKRQKDHDTEIVGGKNPIYIWKKYPGISDNNMEIEDYMKDKIDLGESDLARNLDLKLDLVEKSITEVREEQKNEKSIERTIKRFQNHALNVLGGLKPAKIVKHQEVDDAEFNDLIAEKLNNNDANFHMPIEKKVVQVVNDKLKKSTLDDEDQTAMKTKMGINITANFQKLRGTMDQLTKDNEEKQREERRKEIIWPKKENEKEYMDVFKEVFEASNVKKLDIPTDFSMKYQEYNERSNSILRLFYALLLNEDFVLDEDHMLKLDKMAQLINELKGEINKYNQDSLQVKYRELNQNQDKEKEKIKGFEKFGCCT